MGGPLETARRLHAGLLFVFNTSAAKRKDDGHWPPRKIRIHSSGCESGEREQRHGCLHHPDESPMCHDRNLRIMCTLNRQDRRRRCRQKRLNSPP